ELEKILKESFPNSIIKITDLLGDQDHYALEISDVQFNGLSLINQHKLVDYIIFASGRSTENVGAIAGYVALELKNNAGINSNIEGLGKSEWVLIDAGTILINIFYPEAREYFKLEEIWKR
ncbi:MAG: ribosome silencing factor, partial [Rickettsia endosymbiont of Ixodes persulcatus]|nr:ribosome silencing factor [Rickettsia endosymbiont of Ixodes persulcatus]